MTHHLYRTLALAGVLVLALTAFVSTGSAAGVHPDPFQSGSAPKVDVRSHAPKVDVYSHPDPFGSTGFSSGPDQDVRSTPNQDVRSTPDQDVRSRTPRQDVRGHAAPHAAKTWASKAWGSSWS